jgi:hypothetical protein
VDRSNALEVVSLLFELEERKRFRRGGKKEEEEKMEEGQTKKTPL